MRTIDQTLTELIMATAPSLLELYGVGPDTVASLLATAGDNPGPDTSMALSSY